MICANIILNSFKFLSFRKSVSYEFATLITIKKQNFFRIKKLRGKDQIKLANSCQKIILIAYKKAFYEKKEQNIVAVGR